MNKLSTIEKIEVYLFKRGVDIVVLDDIELSILRRLEDGYAQKLDKPEMPDKELRDYLMKTYKIEKSQAYKDINNIQILLANVTNASRAWHQYTANKWATEIYNDSKKAKNKEAMNSALNSYGKFNRLDKDEIEKPPYNHIIPPDFEPVMDPTLLGKKPIEHREEYLARLRKKYKDQYFLESAEDATIE